MSHPVTRVAGAALLSALLPVAAHAQTPALPDCAPGETASWISGDAATSVLGESPLQQTARFGNNAGLLAAFIVEGEERQIRIELGNETRGDPTLKLFAADGRLIREIDDFEGNLGSRLEETLAPGVYCARAGEVSGGALIADLRVSEMSSEPIVASMGTGGASSIPVCTAATEAETFDAAAFATALTENSSLSASMSGSEGARYFRFSLPANANLRLTAKSPTLDPRITLFDANGTMIADNDDADGTDSRLDMIGGLDEGDYCLGVVALSPGEGTITVQAGGVDPSDLLRDAHRQGQIPPGADSGYPVTPLDIQATGPQIQLLGAHALWFSFELTERQVLVISGYGMATGIDTRLALFNGHGARVEENDDANGSTDPQIGPVILEPGRYSLALSEVGGSGAPQGQVRAVSIGIQRFLPAK